MKAAVGNFATIDIKTGFEMLPYTAIQTAAYEFMWAETIKRKESMDLTFDEVNHVYKLDGLAIPYSVTGVLQKVGIADFSMVPPHILEAAQKFGTAVHRACEFHDKGTLDERSLDVNLWPYLDAWSQFVKDYTMEFIAIEQPIASTVYRIAGMPDRIAKSETRRRLAVLLGPEGAYKVTEYKDKNDWQVFVAAMSVVNWKGRYLK